MFVNNFVNSIFGIFGLEVIPKVANTAPEEIKETNSEIVPEEVKEETGLVSSRFLLTSEGFPEQYVKSTNFDYHFKHVTLTMYNHCSLQSWVEKVKENKDKTLTFSMYNECGHLIFAYRFDGLQIFSDNARFDYETNNLSTRYIGLSFKELKLLDKEIAEK
jgi:hypothetical protein